MLKVRLGAPGTSTEENCASPLSAMFLGLLAHVRVLQAGLESAHDVAVVLVVLLGRRFLARANRAAMGGLPVS